MLQECSKNTEAHRTESSQETHREQEKKDPFSGDEINWTSLGIWAAEEIKSRICFVETEGWGFFNGTYWRFSKDPSAPLLDFVRSRYCDKTGDIAAKLNSNPKSTGYLLDYAKGRLIAPREKFNRSEVAHLVAFKNITVDLKTGKTMQHDPKHYMTGGLQCNYNEKANFRRVVKTFARYWPEDPETAEMLQTAIGYSMTGEVSAKRIFMLVGNQDVSFANGDNGKSLLQNALIQLFGADDGGLGTSVKPGLVLDNGKRDANGHDGAKAPLIWKRFAIASEPPAKAEFEPGEFNRICGGDVQIARLPHAKHSINFVNIASIWMSMNVIPRFVTWDKATRTRLTPFPFTQTFYEKGATPDGCQEKEIGLKEWFESEDGKEALGLYAVRGARNFYKCNKGKAGNFPDSKAVRDFRDEILKAANPFDEMFETLFEFTKDADIDKSAMAPLLEDFLGTKPTQGQKGTFNSALQGRGVENKKINGTRKWRGVGLSPAGLEAAKRCGVPNCETRR